MIALNRWLRGSAIRPVLVRLAHWGIDPRRLLSGQVVEARLAGGVRIRLLYDVDQLVTRCLRNEGQFEGQWTRFFGKHIRVGDVTVDVGANVGYYTILFAQLVGDKGGVYAGEALFGSALRHNLRLNGLAHQRTIVIFDGAVSDAPGNVAIFQATRHALAQSSMHGRDSLQAVRRMVSATTLDDLCRDAKRIDWIKIDVEGAEAKVLHGARSLLNRFHPTIVTAWSPDGLDAMGTPETELAHLLQVEGYQIFVPDDAGHLRPLQLPMPRTGEHMVLATVEPGRFSPII